MPNEFVWIFNGSKGKFPGGVFKSLELAEQWISANKLTGVLTQYPLDVGSYDWAKNNNLLSKKIKSKAEPEFIGSFSSASFVHFHYEEGKRE